MSARGSEPGAAGRGRASGRRTPKRRRAAPPDAKIRPLNRPNPLRVDSKDGVPIRLHQRGAWRRVGSVLDRWRIDDEWWREPISRAYFSIVLDGGAHLTLYHDLIEDRWYRQPV